MAIISVQTNAFDDHFHSKHVAILWLPSIIFAMEAVSESVSETLCYKQRAEKSIGGEMVLMKWSPVADLLAAAFSDRSVSVLFLSQAVHLFVAPMCSCDLFTRVFSN